MSKPAFWSCPVCHQALLTVENRFQCAANHSYDRAKQGYVNLLLANQKHSKEPGDSAEMILARRGFLAAGGYRFLVEAMAKVIADHLANNKEDGHVVDLGCGEGYYLRELEKCLTCERNVCFRGIDISKPAVRLSAGAMKQAEFAVASTFHLPMLDNVADVAISVFAPFSETEVCRIVKPGGIFIRVSPAERHLWQLKEKLYSTPELHQPAKPLAALNITDECRVTRTVTMQSREEIVDLLGMTPLHWCGDAKARETLLTQQALTIDFDFTIQTMQCNG